MIKNEDYFDEDENEDNELYRGIGYNYHYGSYGYPPYQNPKDGLCHKLLDELLKAHKRELAYLDEKYKLTLALIEKEID